MAENTVVKEQLTEPMIEAGELLVRKLDEMGVPVSSAFWLFDAEVNEWRLFLASPEVDAKGPLHVYGMIHEATRQLDPDSAEVLFLAVGLLSANAELPRLMRGAIRAGSGISRIRFRKNVMGGRLIDDALIYRAA